MESGSSFVEVVASPRRAAVASMSDEEVSDPKALLEDRSKAKCVYQWYEYQKCVKRIEDDETGQKHCTGQYFDYWKCVDKNVSACCLYIQLVAEKLFDSLK
uniref:Cytochrome b-c1 complex subunit 6 n=1 Tax=Oryza glaberrima TaxID=4538 RepID=I1P134_ORYGL